MIMDIHVNILKRSLKRKTSLESRPALPATKEASIYCVLQGKLSKVFRILGDLLSPDLKITLPLIKVGCTKLIMKITSDLSEKKNQYEVSSLKMRQKNIEARKIN